MQLFTTDLVLRTVTIQDLDDIARMWDFFDGGVSLEQARQVLDYITGSMAAGKAGEWESRKAREGIYHKGGMLVIVLVAAATDLLISLVLDNLPMLALPVEYSGLVCPVVLVWYIVTELGSITENAVAMGAPVPALLTKLLKVTKDAVEQMGVEDV